VDQIVKTLGKTLIVYDKLSQFYKLFKIFRELRYFFAPLFSKVDVLLHFLTELQKVDDMEFFSCVYI